MNAAVMRIEDFNDDFDPFTAILTAGNEAHVTDPFSEYDRLLRTGGPVHKLDLRRHLNVHPDVTMEGLEVYTVLGFDACSEVLMNSSQFTNAIYRRNLGITFGESVTVMDGADHARYRRLFQSVFTPKMLAALKPRFQAVVGAKPRTRERSVRAAGSPMPNVRAHSASLSGPIPAMPSFL